MPQKNITIKEIAAKRGNLNSEDVFIIDNFFEIYQVGLYCFVLQMHNTFVKGFLQGLLYQFDAPERLRGQFSPPHFVSVLQNRIPWDYWRLGMYILQHRRIFSITNCHKADSIKTSIQFVCIVWLNCFQFPKKNQ